ncbi:MAG: carbohydrate-binding protein, partial [Porticoccaceae bacterium]
MKHLKSFKSTYQSIVSSIKLAAMKILAIMFVSSSSLAVANVATWQAFDGTTIDADTSTFEFPVSASSWAGFSNDNSGLYPMCFGDGGTVTFTGAVPSDGTANVKFRFEKNPYPDVEPSIDLADATVSGSTESNYSLAVPAQDAANTYSSLVMYIVEQDTPVIIKDVAVASTSCPEPEAPADPTAGDFSEAFGGTSIDGSVYTFPSSAEVWGGFANMNEAMYPLSFVNGGSISFDASVIGEANRADIRFRLEYQPHPNVDPAYDLDVVIVANADKWAAGNTNEYTVNIPPQGSNTYSSLIMYILDRDVGVSINNVVVNSDGGDISPVDPVDPVDPSTVTLAVGDSVDFETDVAIESFGGVNGSIVNGVLEAVKESGAETWGGNVVAKGFIVYPLTATDTLMTAEVHSTVAATIRMKLELASDGNQSAEVDSIVGHTGSGWETLTFNFAGTDAIGANFDTLVLFPNFGVAGAGNTYQYDNVTFAGGVSDVVQPDPCAVEADQSGTLLIEGECYDPSLTVGDLATEGAVGPGGNLGWFDPAESVSYKINVPTAGNYALSYSVATQNSGVTIEVSVDDVLTDAITFDSTGGWTTWADQTGRVVT